MGCDFMKCAPPGGCGKAFCYVCSKPITEVILLNKLLKF